MRTRPSLHSAPKYDRLSGGSSAARAASTREPSRSTPTATEVVRSSVSSGRASPSASSNGAATLGVGRPVRCTR